MKGNTSAISETELDEDKKSKTVKCSISDERVLIANA
jgi:hypothetical protein